MRGEVITAPNTTALGCQAVRRSNSFPETRTRAAMTASAEQDPRYPIGTMPRIPTLSAAERVTAIDDIAVAPRNLRNAVAGLTDEQIDTPYRSGGWTVRQVVHHVADSHVNAYT